MILYHFTQKTNLSRDGLTISYIMYLTNDSILLVLFYKNVLCNYLKYCQYYYADDS